MSPADLPMLYEWLCRPHVAQWWPSPDSLREVAADFTQHTDPESPTRGYIALLGDEPIGFIQSYVVPGSGDGWWEDETDGPALLMVHYRR